MMQKDVEVVVGLVFLSGLALSVPRSDLGNLRRGREMGEMQGEMKVPRPDDGAGR